MIVEHKKCCNVRCESELIQGISNMENFRNWFYEVRWDDRISLDESFQFVSAKKNKKLSGHYHKSHYQRFFLSIVIFSKLLDPSASLAIG